MVRESDLVAGSGGEEFIDDRLEPVTQDNVSVDVHIGPEDAFEFVDGEVHPDSTGTTFADARRYHALQLEIDISNSSESNIVIGQVIGDGHNIPPSEGDPLDEEESPEVITVDVDNELMEYRDSADAEITRLFTGVISNKSRMAAGMFEFVAFWPGFNELQEGTVDVTVPPTTRQLEEDMLWKLDYDHRRTTTSVIAERIGEKITSGTKFPYQINLREGGYDIGGIKSGDDTEITVDNPANADITTDDATGALTRAVEASNAVWDIDRWGTFTVGPAIPEGDVGNGVPTTIKAHKLRYITDSDAGMRSPIWNSIQVIGDGVVSQDGWAASGMVNENPAVFADDVEGTEDTEGAVQRSGELAEPTFVYRNMEINTTKEAKNVLEDLKEELRSQMAGGQVTVVGHPELWPGDAIELPDAPDQPFNLERFLVTRVTHHINNDDGFITVIEVGGQTNAVETVFSDDENFPEPPLEDREYGEILELEDYLPL